MKINLDWLPGVALFWLRACMWCGRRADYYADDSLRSWFWISANHMFYRMHRLHAIHRF